MSDRNASLFTFKIISPKINYLVVMMFLFSSTLFASTNLFEKNVNSYKKYFKILEQNITSDGNVSFVIKYLSDIPLDINNSFILFNNRMEKQHWNYISENNLFSFQKNNLKEGKYSLELRFKDDEGKVLPPIYFPFWIEKNKFRWNDGIMYQVITDRFYNGDTSNDDPHPEVPYATNWQGGDFAGLIDKLEEGYFDKLGINILYISSPIINTNQKGGGISDSHSYTAYHSYWPVGTGWTDENPLEWPHTPIEPHFGTREELKKLVNFAHQKGIRVVADFVANHVHHESVIRRHHHDWFHNLYICGWDRPIICWFTDYLPDFDYDRQEVIDVVVDHALWLIKEFNFDGFRLDALKHMEMKFINSLRYSIKENIETTGLRFYLLGETFTGDQDFDLIGRYLGEDKVDGQFDFPLFYNISRTFLLKHQSFRDFYQFYKNTENIYQTRYYQDALMSNFLGNHDIPRAISVANGDFYPDMGVFGGNTSKYRAWNNPPVAPEYRWPYLRLQMAHTFLFTVSGIPLLYQGDEFGQAGANDPDNRRLMKFGPELNQYQQETMERISILSEFRKNHPAAVSGVMTERWINENVLAYSMEKDDDFFLVVFNKNDFDYAININLEHIGFNSGMFRDIFTRSEFFLIDGSMELSLPANSAMVLEQM